MTSQQASGPDYEYELSVAEIKIRHLEAGADASRASAERLTRQVRLLQARVAQAREEAEQAERDRENLETALVTAREIGAAVGVLMVTAKITYDAAFEALSRESQRRNRKLRDLAVDVVLTGVL